MQEIIVYIKNNLIDTDGVIYLTIDFLIKVNKIKTGLNNITLRKVSVKLYEFNKMNMNKELIDNKLYQITDQFNGRKVTSTKFYSILLKKMHPFMMELVEPVRYCLL